MKTEASKVKIVPKHNTTAKRCTSRNQDQHEGFLLDQNQNFFENMKRRNPKTNKTRTPQVGAISKAQKAQNIFFGKKLEIFEKKISFRKSRTVPKNVKGGPFLIYKHAFCSKITKNSKGGPFGDIKKNRKKNLTAPKKIERGGVRNFSPVRACM